MYDHMTKRLFSGEDRRPGVRFDRAGFITEVAHERPFCANEPKNLAHPSTGGSRRDDGPSKQCVLWTETLYPSGLSGSARRRSFGAIEAAPMKTEAPGLEGRGPGFAGQPASIGLPPYSA